MLQELYGTTVSEETTAYALTLGYGVAKDAAQRVANLVADKVLHVPREARAAQGELHRAFYQTARAMDFKQGKAKSKDGVPHSKPGVTRPLLETEASGYINPPMADADEPYTMRVLPAAEPIRDAYANMASLYKLDGRCTQRFTELTTLNANKFLNSFFVDEAEVGDSMRANKAAMVYMERTLRCKHHGDPKGPAGAPAGGHTLYRGPGLAEL